MNKKQSYPSGPWEPLYISGCCYGVGRIKTTEEGAQHEVFLNTVLPETDKEYEKQRDQIVAIARLAATSPELLECLLEAIESIELETGKPAEKWRRVAEKALGFKFSY